MCWWGCLRVTGVSVQVCTVRTPLHGQQHEKIWSPPPPTSPAHPTTCHQQQHRPALTGTPFVPPGVAFFGLLQARQLAASTPAADGPAPSPTGAAGAAAAPTKASKPFDRPSGGLGGPGGAAGSHKRVAPSAAGVAAPPEKKGKGRQ
jgi:hypothetical protein